MKHMSAQHVVESLSMGYYGSLGNWSIDTYRYLLMRDADGRKKQGHTNNKAKQLYMYPIVSPNLYYTKYRGFTITM